MEKEMVILTKLPKSKREKDWVWDFLDEIFIILRFVIVICILMTLIIATEMPPVFNQKYWPVPAVIAIVLVSAAVNIYIIKEHLELKSELDDWKFIVSLEGEKWYILSNNIELDNEGNIKIRNGALCKEGDTVKCWQKGHKDKADQGKLAFDDKYTQTLNLLVGEDDWYMLFGEEKEQVFELVEACEPDVCRNF